MRAIRAFVGGAMIGGLLVMGAGCESATETTPPLDSAPATGVDGGAPPANQEAYKKQYEKPAGTNPYGEGYPGAQARPNR